MRSSVALQRSWFSRQVMASDLGLLLYLAAGKLLLHLLTSSNYGYFRDELYYIAASKRLALGYVDFPPFIAMITALIRSTMGDSLFALRLLPAVAGAILVVLTGLMARELGGGRFAQALAALATFIAPNVLVFGTFLSMDAFDQLWWVLATFVLLRLLKTDQPRLWVLFGMIAAIGLMTKITMLFFGFAVFVGVLLMPTRKYVRSPWFWLAGGIACLGMLPYLIWQIHNGWPTLAFWENYGTKVYEGSPLEFLLQQIVTMHPLTVPLWLAGLSYYFFAQAGKPYRLFGWMYLILFVQFTIQNAKSYFLAPIYPALFAAGAFVIEQRIQQHRWNWLKPASLSVLALGGALLALVLMPILPIATLARITEAAGGDAGVRQETREVGELPQHLADRFGWEGMVATIGRVYERLPAEDRTKACILVNNYGEAGAVDFFGAAYKLPNAISGHNNYYLWGPRNCTGEVVIATGTGFSAERLSTVFNRIEHVDTIRCQYCMPDENNLPVYVARNPKVSLREAWPQFKHYN